MRFNRIQLKLWTVGILGMSCLWFGPAAIAQSAETTLSENAEVTYRSGHDCFDLDTEQPEPLGEFREALLNTAAVTARQVEHPAQKVDALVTLSKSYICLGQVALADSTAAEALSSVDQIETVDERGSALVDLASLYGEHLNDSAQMDVLLSQVIALIDVESEVSQEQTLLISRIARRYINARDYSNLRSVFDLVDESDPYFPSIQDLIHQAYYSALDEDKTTIRELFPELESYFSQRDSFADFQQDPLIAWLNQLHQSEVAFQAPSEQDVLDAFIREQVSILETFPTVVEQAYGYTMLGLYLGGFGNAEEAISLLELAVKKSESIDDLTIPVDSDSYLLGNQLDHVISMGFMIAGDVERGLSILKENSNLVEQVPAQIDVLLQTAQALIYDERNATATQILGEAESFSGLLEAPESYLLQIAIAYVELDDLENARRLSRLIVNDSASSQELLSDEYTVGEIVNLFSLDGRPEDILELAKSAESQSLLPSLAAQSLSHGQDDIAWQIFDLIVSPSLQSNALVAMAKEYYYLEDADRAVELASRAVTIAQSDDYSQDEYFSELVEEYNEYGDYDLDSIVNQNRESVAYEALFFLVHPEQIQAVIQLIDDEAFKARLRDAFLSEGLSESEGPLNSESGDSDLRSTASNAAREGRFQVALEAVAAMESAYDQSKTLVNIAKCHANSATVLDDEMRSLLEQIQLSANS